MARVKHHHSEAATIDITSFQSTFQSEKGKPVYVTKVTAYANDHVIARNFRYDTGNVMMIKENGCLNVIDGQDIKLIQAKPLNLL